MISLCALVVGVLLCAVIFLPMFVIGCFEETRLYKVPDRRSANRRTWQTVGDDRVAWYGRRLE